MNKVSNEQINQIMENAVITCNTLHEKVTIVTAKLYNDFVIVEASGAVDKENYSEEIGKEICLERIRNKVWELEGYHLACKLSDN